MDRHTARPGHGTSTPSSDAVITTASSWARSLSDAFGHQLLHDEPVPAVEGGGSPVDHRRRSVRLSVRLDGHRQHRASRPELGGDQMLAIVGHQMVEHLHTAGCFGHLSGDVVGGEIDCFTDELSAAAWEIVVGRSAGAPLAASTSAIAVECAPRSRINSAAEATMRWRGLFITLLRLCMQPYISLRSRRSFRRRIASPVDESDRAVGPQRPPRQGRHRPHARSGLDHKSHPTAQHVLVVFVEVEWSEIGASFPIRAELVDGDGARVAHTEEGVINARRHPIHPEGTPVTIPFIATIPPLNLKIGERYQWRVSISDEMHEDWLAGFTVTEGK